MRNRLPIIIAGLLVFVVRGILTAQNLFTVTGGNQIVKFAANGTYSTFATVPGNALGLAFDSAGDLFVPNTGNGTIIKITPNGTQSVFATGLQTPAALAFNNTGDLFVSDIGNGQGNIYEFSPNGVRSTFATNLYVPYGLAFNSAGDLFAVNNGNTIYEFTPNGVRSTFATVSGLGMAGIAFNGAGDLFVAAWYDYILKFTPNGVESTFASGFDHPDDLAFNNAGDLFVSCSASSPPWIYEIAPDGTRSAFESSVGAIGLAFQGVTLPVPEPSVWALLGAGGFVLFSLCRKINGG